MTRAPQPFRGRGAQGAARLRYEGVSRPRAAWSRRATAHFRKIHSAAGSRISPLRSFYPDGLWRENTRMIRVRTMSRRKCMRPATSFMTERWGARARRSSAEDSTPVAGWSEHAQGHDLDSRWTPGWPGQCRCVGDARSRVSIAQNLAADPRKDDENSIAFA